MARHADAAELLKAGFSPQLLAKHFGIPLGSVTQYLYTAVARGLISRSEVLFSIDDETAQAVEFHVANLSLRDRWELQDLLLHSEVSRDDVDEALLYFDFREAPLADMYEVLSRTERFLHSHIKITLQRSHGPDAFWRQLPLAVRRDCVHIKEEDGDSQDDPYSYTTFIHLKVIFDKHWHTLSKGLPQAVAKDKKKFLDALTSLNAIRNKVMHPVRGYKPSSADFEHVSHFALAMFGEPDTTSRRQRKKMTSG